MLISSISRYKSHHPYMDAILQESQSNRLHADSFPSLQARYDQPPDPNHSRYVQIQFFSGRHGNALSYDAPGSHPCLNMKIFHDKYSGLAPKLQDHKSWSRQSPYHRHEGCSYGMADLMLARYLQHGRLNLPVPA